MIFQILSLRQHNFFSILNFFFRETWNVTVLTEFQKLLTARSVIMVTKYIYSDIYNLFLVILYDISNFEFTTTQLFPNFELFFRKTWNVKFLEKFQKLLTARSVIMVTKYNLFWHIQLIFSYFVPYCNSWVYNNTIFPQFWNFLRETWNVVVLE